MVLSYNYIFRRYQNIKKQIRWLVKKARAWVLERRWLKVVFLFLFFVVAGIAYLYLSDSSDNEAQAAFALDSAWNGEIEASERDTKEPNVNADDEDSQTDNESVKTKGKDSVKDGSDSSESKTESIAEQLLIHVCGEVVNPGVYELPKGSRVHDAVNMAGGVTPEGAADYLNLAAPLSDGDKVVVPSFSQMEGESLISQTAAPQASEQEAGSYTVTLVNINSADKNSLMTLPGIGETKAETILAYREANGPFTSIEDIMKVTGIKDKAFDKIKDYITVDG